MNLFTKFLGVSKSSTDPGTFDPHANENDIESCYRLLLGRTPDPTGLRHLRAAIRQNSITVQEMVDGFLHSSEFKQLQARRGSSASSHICVDLNGFQLCVESEDPMLGKHLSEAKVYEPHVTAIFQQAVKPGMTVVDVGANVGYYTMLAARELRGSGKVLAFEPASQNVSLLHYNVQLNGFADVVEVYPFALADGPRLVVLDMHGSNGVMSEFPGDLKGLTERSLFRCMALDQLVKLDRCDVLKIDVEGAEGLVVKGAENHLRRHRPLVFSEFAPDSLLCHSSMKGDEYLSFWVSLGYQINIVHRTGQVEEIGQNVDAMMLRWEQEQWGHIDLLLQPQSAL